MPEKDGPAKWSSHSHLSPPSLSPSSMPMNIHTKYITSLTWKEPHNFLPSYSTANKSTN